MGTVRYTTVNGEVIAEKRNGVRSLYVPDPLGSTVALLDNTQTRTDTFTYWPYGEENVRTGTTPTPFRFVGTEGYYRDSASKTYVRARHLGTQKGRWLTQDPLGLNAGDTNLYRYVFNIPALLTDRTGMISCKVCWALIWSPLYSLCRLICRDDKPKPDPCAKYKGGCDLYKSSPNPASCQDCCDEKLLQALCKKVGGGIDDLAKCFADCQKGRDNSDLPSCIQKCVIDDLNGGKAYVTKVKNYLRCCYLGCDRGGDGTFQPPGGCEKHL
jgi:RHS repeat-associated protein